MGRKVQLRGGTTLEHTLFTGGERELTIDTDKKTAIIHDGITPGGFEVALKSSVDALLAAATDDANTFAEVVALVNSVDTENDTAFAGYVVSNNLAVSAKLETMTENDFTATPNQTSFPVIYTPGRIQVFVEGIKAKSSTFTATDGTNVIFNAGLDADSWVQVVVFS